MYVTLKNKGCSESKTSMKIRCSKQVAHYALSYFTKHGTYRYGQGDKRVFEDNVGNRSHHDELMVFCLAFDF